MNLSVFRFWIKNGYCHALIPVMKKIFFLSLTSLFLLPSCKKAAVSQLQENPSVEVSAQKMSQIKVPMGFNWETSRNVNLKISTTDSRFGTSLHKLIVYSADPNQGGVKLVEGSISLGNDFKANVSITNSVRTLFLVKIAPNQSKLMEKVSIENNALVANMSILANPKLNKEAGPDCSTGCTSNYSLTGGTTYTASAGTVCISNTNINGSIIIANGATVRICGNGNLANITLASGATLILTNNANVNITQKFISNGTVSNYGTVRFHQDLEINSGTFTNHGDLTVLNDVTTNQGASLVNNASFTVNNNHKTDKGSTTNNCFFWVKKEFEISGVNVNYPVFLNNGYLRVDDNSNINDGAAMTMGSGAMFKTKSIDLQSGKIIGTSGSGSANSLIKISNGGSINAAARISGLVQICTNISLPNGLLISGASAGCSVYIPSSECNPDGNGAAPILDDDKDGVCNENDEYPDDCDKAHKNICGTSTVAFEDLFPYKGDYDLNDVVVSYTYKVITNAANKVVKVEATYQLRATGGHFENGFGVQFPINRNQVSGLSGATLEQGQSKAVLILFTNMHNELSSWNTFPNQAAVPFVSYNVSFNVTGAPSLESFGLSSFNPFIWNGTEGYGRGYEVHLPGKLPTDLADKSLFGTGDDASNIGSNDTYISKDGRYPWAINIPATFNYPIENADINIAYLKFATWVSSGGNLYKDWYTNGNAYRNNAFIY